MAKEFFRSIYVVTYREILRFIRERSRLISAFLMPIMFLVVFGAGFNRLIGEISPGVDFIQFMFPGILAMTVVMGSLFSALSILWDREFGFLKELLIAPLSRTGIILGKALGGALTSSIRGLILLGFAPVIGINITPALILKLIPMILLLSITLSGVGFVIAARMRSQQGFQGIMNFVFFPIIFLSGVFFPLTSTPNIIQTLSKFNPMTYGVDALRQIFFSDQNVIDKNIDKNIQPIGIEIFGHITTVWENITILAVIGIILMMIATWMFSKQE